MEKKLIVNADDYGHLAGVSLGIGQAYLKGIVTSTSVMMNRPGAVNAIRIAQTECPGLGLGVHLVLTSGKPLLPPNRVSTLIDGEGFFHRPPALLEKSNEIEPAQVAAEWLSQLEAFKKAAGCSPDHLDSHHHISYANPALFELMLTLAAQEGAAIRVPYGVEDTLFAENETVELLERFHPRHAQVFLGDFYDQDATLEKLKDYIEKIAEDPKHRTFELMCHPAVVDDELRQTSVYNDKRDEERILLQSEEIKLLLEKKHILLIRYSELT
jgi:chitin disaccharide deacetylase